MPPNKKTQRILVIKLSALGDFIIALGPMKAIRQHHQDAHITLLTTQAFADFGKQCGYFNDVIIDNRPKWNNVKGWIDLFKILNGFKIDRVYDLQNNDRTQLYFHCFLKKPEWIGTAIGASHRYIAPDRKEGLAFDRHARMLAFAGISCVSIDTMDWIKADLSQFNLDKKYAIIVPGSAPTRPEKRWPVKHYIKICDTLITKDIQPVLIGTDAESTITEDIQNACPTCLNLTGKTTLNDIIALGQHAQLCIGNDTGPMHMIAPTGTPTFVLFTKFSDPTRHAPAGDNVHILEVDNRLDTDVIEQIIRAI